MRQFFWLATLLASGCSLTIPSLGYERDSGTVVPDAGPSEPDATTAVPDGGPLDAGTLDAMAPPDATPDGGLAASVTQISLGSLHSCALMSDGRVLCWGDNRSGQLGDGTQFDRAEPRPVEGLPPADLIDAGADYTCARTRDGELWCWGGNALAQLGDGTRTDRLRPVRIDLAGVAALTAGGGHTCALLAPGAVRCWGNNSLGQLGNGSTDESTTPTPAMDLSGVTALSRDGGQHTCGIAAGGTLRCWGDNRVSQLGNGTTDPVVRPVDVVGIDFVSQVSVNIFHSCAIRTGGELRCWGGNDDGRLGDGTNMVRRTPVVVPLPRPATAVSLSRFATCAGTTAGTVYCWGSNSRGQLGQGASGPVSSSSPLLVAGIDGVLEIAGGREHFCSRVTGDGRESVLCWGDNSSGQLGPNAGVLDQSSEPVEVTF